MTEYKDSRNETLDAGVIEAIPGAECSNLEPSTYQVFFRTNKGGCGIEYETARAEFFSVFRNQRVELVWELSSRMRMDVIIDGLSDDEIRQRAEKLGYTQGIVSVHEEPYLGEDLHWRKTGRWAVGWLRNKDKKKLLTEIYRQNGKKLLEEAPHNRVFLIEWEGEVKAAKGHRYRRGMSPADTKFMINIAELEGNELVLDPFAGTGGILIECRKRGLKTFAADIDSVLRPGLAQFSENQATIADARRLPFKDNAFDVIITEPPFNTRYRQAVLDSVPELNRVIREEGKIILLIAQDMHQEIMECMDGSRFQLTGDYRLRRHGKLISHVLKFEFPKPEE